MAITSVGIISVMSTKPKMSHLPGKRKKTKAMPASSASVALPVVMTSATMTELTM